MFVVFEINDWVTLVKISTLLSIENRGQKQLLRNINLLYAYLTMLIHEFVVDEVLVDTKETG
jgi:hypothetical protein